MEPDACKALISRIADDIWNRGDLAVVDDVMSPHAKYHGPHMPNGLGDRDTWRRAISMYRNAFPDSHVTYQDLIVCGNTVIGRWNATATHTGPMPGVQPTQKKIAIEGITIYRIVDGKIAEAWEQLDMLGMWQQIGVVSLPARE